VHTQSKPGLWQDGIRGNRGVGSRHNAAMNIVILDDYQDAVRKLPCAAKLEPYAAKVYTNTVKGMGQLSIRLKDADIVVLIRERTQLTRAIIEKLPRLKLIVQTGRVGSHLDVQACTERGVAVAEGSGMPLPTAELTWALVMAAMRRLPQYIGNLKHGAWQQSGLKAASMPPNFGIGSQLSGKTLGIWGYGRIGKLVAGYGKAFGMQILVWGREASRQQAELDGYATADSREAFFASSDVLSLHLRLNDETRGMVRLDDLSAMKPTALLVNTSRAELIEPDALIAALNRGKPGMAAVDVFEAEPILQGHALLRIENCICTPHIGYVEQENYQRMFSEAFDNVVNFIRGTPSNIVNPGALQVRR
jgi:D-3-phosphoglycerate dehydrogenase / 2-oxoglutarate reductase